MARHIASRLVTWGRRRAVSRAPSPVVVVVVTVEKGGFGAATAAPAARRILSEWFGVKDTEFHTGTSVTR